jgi:hypothetical protein
VGVSNFPTKGAGALSSAYRGAYSNPAIVLEKTLAWISKFADVLSAHNTLAPVTQPSLLRSYRRDLFVKILPEGSNGQELSRRREAVVSALAQKGWAAQARVSARVRFARTYLPTRTREGGKGGTAAPAQKHGAVCADRFAEKRTPPPCQRRFSLAPQLRQSADRKEPAVGLSRPQILELKGWGAALLSRREGRIMGSLVIR